jgi:hypothetical protein
MHTIRLRGPWQLESLQRYVKRGFGGYDSSKIGLTASDRSQMPADWCETMGPDFLGVVRYSRKFNRPTNLRDDRVWLVVEPPRSCCLVRVNRTFIGHVRYGSAAGRFDITDLIEDHNVVDIDVEHPELDDDGNSPNDGSVCTPGGLVGEVRLEIEE